LHCDKVPGVAGSPQLHGDNPILLALVGLVGPSWSFLGRDKTVCSRKRKGTTKKQNAVDNFLASTLLTTVACPVARVAAFVVLLGKAAGVVVMRKLPPRAAKKTKKSVLELEKARATILKSKIRSKPRIADLPPERQTIVRTQNQNATAKKRAKGGIALKLLENQRVHDSYITKTIIVSR
jgi:hypothetical protein